MNAPELIHVTLALVLLTVALGYFRLARTWGIVDRPNERSSHSSPTIRGGGVLFPLAWLAWSIYDDWALPWLTAGVLLLALMGFLDDMRGLQPGLRLAFQVMAFLLLWVELMGLDHWTWWFLPMAFVGIGAINAVNFMDGINGITGLYALAILMPLQWFFAPTWLSPTPWSFLIVGLLIFGWYNFRKKARCFAGDVGSVSLGYILVFFVLTLFLGRNPLIPSQGMALEFQYYAILLLALYGVDSVLTILHRLWLRENILQAHRRHLYQVLANERGWSHIAVASGYALVQGGISVWALRYHPGIWSVLLTLACLSLGYVGIKFGRGLYSRS